jgi:hypothetical protein
MASVVHAPTIRSLPELALEPLESEVEGLVEVRCAGLDAHHRATHSARYLDPLAILGLPGILLVEQLDICSDDPVVIALDPDQLLSDMLPVMLGDLDVPAPHDNIHATSSALRAPAWNAPTLLPSLDASWPVPSLGGAYSVLAPMFGRSLRR